MYDITEHATFTNVARWLSELRASVDTSVPAILIENKSDLERLRAVSTDEGKAFASAYSCSLSPSQVITDSYVSAYVY